jgi:acyl-CoA synthetase (AMP-forming)/AMP-acid ligase II
MTSSLDLLTLGGASASASAVVTPDGETLSYDELQRRVSRCRAALAWPAKALVVVDTPRTLPGLVGYLAALSAGHAVTLVEEAGATLWDELVAAYRPELLVGADGVRLAGQARQLGFRPRDTADPAVWWRPDADPSAALHPGLAMLARTSGSLGRPKGIRLSFDNLRSNALAIVAALGLRRDDRAMTALPLDYSLGLSLVNSAFAAAASVALTTQSPSGSTFWRQLDAVAGTVVGAVPSSYAFLRTRSWDPASHPSLRLLLCSGAPIDETVCQYHVTRMAAVGGGFVPMYGQTEATARIACLPADLAASRVGSVGVAIPGTQVTVEDPAGTPVADGEAGEIVVRGPGVMMGYAHSREDLAAADGQGGVLRTGDLGYLRGEFLYVTGRLDRQVKLFGRRIDLDQVERHLREQDLDAAVDAAGDELAVVVAGPAPARRAEHACRHLASRLGLPAAAVRLHLVAHLPRNDHGKVDRRAVRNGLTATGGRTEARLSSQEAMP